MIRSTITRIGQQNLAFVAYFALVVFYPLLARGGFERGVGITIGAMAVGTVGFVLLIGFAHQLALGQAAFYIIGGYGTAILIIEQGWSPLTAMAASIIVAMVLAYFIGKPTLKLHGFNLAMASLAFQLLLIVLATELRGLTGGALGMPGVPKFSLFGMNAVGDLTYYYVVWFFVTLSIVIGLNIDHSRIGRGLRAIAASETAASSLGIDMMKYKLQMFVMSAGMASVAGSLTVHYLRIMEPHMFSFDFSLLIITAVIIGGLHSIWGGAIGASVIIGLREVIRNLSFPMIEVIIMGALIVVVLMALPKGVAGVISSAWGRTQRQAGSNPGGEAASSFEGSTGESPSGAEILRPGASILPNVGNPDFGSGPLLTLEEVSKNFGRLAAVSGVSFSVEPHSVTALIGPNGAGKTTLFNLISGHLPVDKGQILYRSQQIERLAPHRVAALGIGRTFQNLQLFGNMNALENVMTGRHRKASSGILRISLRLPTLSREERRIRETAEHYLAFVGLAGARNRAPSTLPFGHQRLLEIARAMALEPILLLLDEPASGLNETETEQMAELILRIRQIGTTVLLVEHDMRLVMGLADHVVVLNYGQKIAEGTSEEIRTDPQVITAYLGSDES